MCGSTFLTRWLLKYSGDASDVDYDVKPFAKGFKKDLNGIQKLFKVGYVGYVGLKRV